jgi:MFS transporter, NRE family, putaive nickel resistance protein
MGDSRANPKSAVLARIAHCSDRLHSGEQCTGAQCPEVAGAGPIAVDTVASDERTDSYRAVLRNEPFRWLWLAVLFSRAGEAIAQVALPLLVYDLTGSSRLLGFMFVISLAPRVVLAPVAGLLADRLDRRRVMTTSAVIRAGSVALIPLADGVWQIAMLAVVIAVCVTFSVPAELSSLPLTVPAAQLVPALSLTQVTNSTMRIIGPAGGAALVGSAGIGAAFWTEAVCFLAAVACFARVVIPQGQLVQERLPLLANARRDIAAGLNVVWSVPIVRGITCAECLWSFMGAAATIAGLIYVEETLDYGDRSELVYGLLSASLSTGAVLGALAASRVERRIGRPTLLAVGYLGPVFALPILAEPSAPFLFGCWFLVGFADAWAVIAMQAYLAESVSDDLRGRVYATWNGVITSAGLVAYGAVGWITDRIGAPWTIALAGLLVGVGGPLVLLATGALTAVRTSARQIA